MYYFLFSNFSESSSFIRLMKETDEREEFDTKQYKINNNKFILKSQVTIRIN